MDAKMSYEEDNQRRGEASFAIAITLMLALFAGVAIWFLAR